MRVALGGIAAVAVLALAPVAEAAQRYASPGGTGVECTQPSPCPLAEAIRKANDGDEVIVGAGVYAVVETLVPEGKGVDIHGDFSGPMPTVKAASFGIVIGGATGGRVAHIEVDNLSPGAGGIQCVAGVVERVRVKVSGQGSGAIGAAGNCLVRDSVVIAEGAKSTALFAGGYEPGTTGLLRNVTAIAFGPESIGVRSGYGPAPPGDFTLDVRNTIADGSAADLYAVEGPNGPGNIVVANSNFDRPKQDFNAKLIDAGGNQAELPRFLSGFQDFFRPVPGSPTIDAGAVDPLIGATDVLGAPRVVGSAPDIGAYEFVPAPAPGQISTLRLTPGPFRPSARPQGCRAKAKPRVCSTVAFQLTAPADVFFTVERGLKGRRVKGACVKQTAANRSKRRCTRYRGLKGSFVQAGAGGQNSFTFLGLLDGKALAPGRYRLVGTAGGAIRKAGFTIAPKPRPKRPKR
jgi:hypothetical protein